MSTKYKNQNLKLKSDLKNRKNYDKIFNMLQKQKINKLLHFTSVFTAKTNQFKNLKENANHLRAK